MKLRCIFAVRTDELDDAAFVAAVAEAARGIPELPSEVVCIFVDGEGGVRWFTYVSTAYERGWSMVDEWFMDTLQERARTLAVHAIDGHFTGSSFQHFKAGKRVRLIAGGVASIAVVGARVTPAHLGRDPLETGLRALGWPNDRAWQALGPDARRIVLRHGGKWVARPTITDGGERLPKIDVRAGSLPDPDRLPKDAQRLRLDTEQLGPPAPAEVKRARYMINRAVELPDLSGTRSFQGTICLVANYDPAGGWGLRVLDLGGIQVMRHPSSLSMQGRCERLRGLHLETADAIACGQVAVELPRLEKVKRASFWVGAVAEDAPGGPGPLVLPALAEVDTLTLSLDSLHPFHVRLPALRKGKVEIFARYLDDRKLAASSIELPLFPAKSIVWKRENSSALEPLPARVRAIVRAKA